MFVLGRGQTESLSHIRLTLGVQISRQDINGDVASQAGMKRIQSHDIRSSLLKIFLFLSFIHISILVEVAKCKAYWVMKEGSLLIVKNVCLFLLSCCSCCCCCILIYGTHFLTSTDGHGFSLIRTHRQLV